MRLQQERIRHLVKILTSMTLFQGEIVCVCAKRYTMHIVYLREGVKAARLSYSEANERAAPITDFLILPLPFDLPSNLPPEDPSLSHHL